MQQMTKKERVQAAIKKQDVDRIPVNVWYHAPDYDQDPIKLAELHVALTHKYDYDFIKMMPFGNYVAVDFGLSCDYFCTPLKAVKEREWGVKTPEEWYDLKPLPAVYGSYGKTLQIAQYIVKFLGSESVPAIQTIFNPLSIARKICGPRTIEDLRNNPKALKAGLEAITETQKNFIKANIEAGVSGFFFANQCSNSDFCTREEYAEFGTKYDEEMLSAITDDAWFNVAHIHGDHTYFDIMAGFDKLNVINWHDRWSDVSTADGRKKTDKCILGGINEKDVFHAASAEQVIEHIGEYVAVAGKKGTMIGPGCVAHPDSPEANFFAARIAAEKFSK